MNFDVLQQVRRLASDSTEATKNLIAEFASELLGEPFQSDGIVFGQTRPVSDNSKVGRYHAFVRALEGGLSIEF